MSKVIYVSIFLIISATSVDSSFPGYSSFQDLVWAADYAVVGTIHDTHQSYFEVMVTEIITGDISKGVIRVATPGCWNEFSFPPEHLYNAGNEVILFLEKYVGENTPDDWGWSVAKGWGIAFCQDGSVPIRRSANSNTTSFFTIMPDINSKDLERVPCKQLVSAAREFRAIVGEPDQRLSYWGRVRGWYVALIQEGSPEIDVEEYRARSNIHKALIDGLTEFYETRCANR